MAAGPVGQSRWDTDLTEVTEAEAFLRVCLCYSAAWHKTLYENEEDVSSETLTFKSVCPHESEYFEHVCT